MSSDHWYMYMMDCTQILRGFLFHIFMICSSCSSWRLSGDSITIFIRFERFSSPKRYSLSEFLLVSFERRIAPQMQFLLECAKVLKSGHIICSISLVASSLIQLLDKVIFWLLCQVVMKCFSFNWKIRGDGSWHSKLLTSNCLGWQLCTIVIQKCFDFFIPIILYIIEWFWI